MLSRELWVLMGSLGALIIVVVFRLKFYLENRKSPDLI